MIPVAELSRPTLAAPLMLSELPDTAPVDVRPRPCSSRRAFEARGWEVVSLDILPKFTPPSAATFCAGTTAPPSRPGASTLCGRHPFAPNTPRRSPQGPAGSTGDALMRLPRAATLGHQKPADGAAQDKALYAAPRIRQRRILLVRTPFKKQTRFWTNMRWAPSCGLCGPGNRCEAWENGRRTRAAQRGPRKIGQRYENVRRQSRELLYSIPAALCDEIAAAAEASET